MYFFTTCYLFLSICTHEFRLFCDPLTFYFWSIRFWKIYDEIILQSTSEALIWFQIVVFITLIIRVAWMNGWFRISCFLLMQLKVFLRWVISSTVTAPWLREFYYYYFLLNRSNSNNQSGSQIEINIFHQWFFISSQFCLVACYLVRLLSTFLVFFEKVCIGWSSL